MRYKFLEIRDAATCIPALALELMSVPGGNPKIHIKNYYLRRTGYGDNPAIVLMMLSSCKATYDPYEWPSIGLGPRTMPVAHNYIVEHFEELDDGDVVDVEFILGETKHKKISERLHHP